MVRVSDPMQIQNQRLRLLAFQAALLAKLAESIEDLADLGDDLPPEERYDPVYRDGWYEQVDSVAVAAHVIRVSYPQNENAFEDRIATWLAEDLENWPVLRLVLLEPWRDPEHHWHRDASAWLRVIGECAERAHETVGPSGARPEGQRLLLDAEAGHFGVVLVYRIDRLGRSLRALLNAHDALSGFGVAIRSATEPFDTTSPIGSFLFQLLASLAELEKSTIAERTSLGRNRVASDGRYTGGPIPIGYDLDAENRFVPSIRFVPELGSSEAEMVTEMFRRIAGGETTLNAEAARLAALGVPTRQRNGGKDGRVIERRSAWRMSSMTTIVHHPGQGALYSRYGQVTRPTPALVDAATWQQAQDALLRNRTLSSSVESRRNGPRKFEADVHLFLRLKPEPIAGENATALPGGTLESGSLN